MKKILLLIFAVLLYSGCEKDEILDTKPVRAIVFEELPSPAIVNLNDITLKFRNGIPVYSSTDVFLQVRKSIYQTSHADYLKWANQNGLNSLYLKYNEWAERIEENPKVLAKEQLDFSAEELLLTSEEGGVFLHPAIPFPKLTDRESRMYIGNSLHYFSPEYHLLIDNGNISDLENLKSDLIHDPENGVIIEFTEEYDEKRIASFSDNPSGAKIAYDLFDCPLDFTNSNDLVRQIPSNVRILSGTSWTPGNYQAFRHKYDEKRFDCPGRRCRQGSKGYLIGLTMVTEVDGNRSFRMIASVEHKYENRRRSWWNWIRTFPDVRFERDPTRFVMDVRFEGIGIQNGVENTLYSNELSVDYPTTDAQNTPHNGSAHGNWILSEKNLLVKYPFSNTTGFKSAIFLTDGRTRHRWINRGDPFNNPMAPTFGCPN